MASLLDFIIELLKIDCGVVQCHYPNEIEAMFYLLFFPTIFIILFIYILTNFIFRGGEMKSKGLRLLISVGAYAFIIFQGLYSLFVSLSQLWWLMAILLVGLFAFIKFMFTGGGDGGDRPGHLPGVGGGAFGGWAKGRMRDVISGDREKLKKTINDRIKTLHGIINQMKHSPTGKEMGELVGQYWNIRQDAENLIKNYSQTGKAGIVDVEKLGDPYWKKMEELTDEFNKVYKK